jgi:hypothetical protein
MYHGFGGLSLTYPVVCVIPLETILDLSVVFFFCSFARLRALRKNEIPSDNHVMIDVCLLDRPEQTTPLLPSPTTTNILRNDIHECEPHMEYASAIPKLRARSVPSYRSSPPKSTCIVLAEIFTWSSQMKDARARQLSPLYVYI